VVLSLNECTYIVKNFYNLAGAVEANYKISRVTPATKAFSTGDRKIFAFFCDGNHRIVSLLMILADLRIRMAH